MSGSSKESQQVVVLSLLGDYYALPTNHAREVIPFSEPRRLPGGGNDVMGLINVRGEILPVRNLRVTLNLAHDLHDSELRRIVLCDTSSGSVGLAVDDVVTVTTIESDEVRSSNALVHPAMLGAFHYGDQLVAMLDMNVLTAVEDTISGPTRPLTQDEYGAEAA